MDTKEYLTNRILEIKQELQGLEAALIAYNNSVGFKNEVPIINEKQSEIFDSSINSNTPNGGTWLEQIVFVIKDRNRFLHNSEIAEALASNYPKKNINEVKRRISAVLSHALSKNEIDGLMNYRFTKSKQDTVWGKEDWINGEGRIKKEHMFFSKKSRKTTVKATL